MPLFDSLSSTGPGAHRLSKMTSIPTTEDLRYALEEAKKRKRPVELPFEHPETKAVLVVRVQLGVNTAPPAWTFINEQRGRQILIWTRATTEVMMIQSKVKSEAGNSSYAPSMEQPSYSSHHHSSHQEPVEQSAPQGMPSVKNPYAQQLAAAPEEPRFNFTSQNPAQPAFTMPGAPQNPSTSQSGLPPAPSPFDSQPTNPQPPNPFASASNLQPPNPFGSGNPQPPNPFGAPPAPPAPPKPPDQFITQPPSQQANPFAAQINPQAAAQAAPPPPPPGPPPAPYAAAAPYAPPLPGPEAGTGFVMPNAAPPQPAAAPPAAPPAFPPPGLETPPAVPSFTQPGPETFPAAEATMPAGLEAFSQAAAAFPPAAPEAIPPATLFPPPALEPPPPPTPVQPAAPLAMPASTPASYLPLDRRAVDNIKHLLTDARTNFMWFHTFIYFLLRAVERYRVNRAPFGVVVYEIAIRYPDQVVPLPDEALQPLSERLLRICTAGEIMSHVENGEFVVLLEAADPDATSAFCGRLYQNLTNQPLLPDADGTELALIAIGGANAAQGTHDPDDLVYAARKAKEQAKQSGAPFVV